MKIKGKERIEHDPEWCCITLKEWVEDGRLFCFNRDNTIITITDTGFPKLPINYCPFCGEKIEV